MKFSKWLEANEMPVGVNPQNGMANQTGEQNPPVVGNQAAAQEPVDPLAGVRANLQRRMQQLADEIPSNMPPKEKFNLMYSLLNSLDFNKNQLKQLIPNYNKQFGNQPAPAIAQ